MHELGLSRSIAAIVEEHAQGRAIKRVRVAIGPLACVERRALDFCWDLVTAQSPLSGAVLEFVEADGDIFLVKDFEFKEAA
ncbi:MAG: hypothetical protein CMI63_14260 [Parvularcula sp.]|jgi:hydrogenase nickel incorporation protein HypA/HybF|nr:hypothetical protein [Parvularcula sp.]